MAIDIGIAATDRASNSSPNTSVNVGNPANATGTIDTVEIWFDTNATLVEFATFFVVSGNNLSTRDSEAIGNVTSGSKQTFTGLDMDVTIGDYLGEYNATGFLELDTSGGDGRWVVGGDNIPCTNVAFTLQAGMVLSLYGTGTEPATGAVMKVNNPKFSSMDRLLARP